MQLETGKSKNGLVGTLRNIVREEGYVNQLEPKADSRLTKKIRVGRLYRGKRTAYVIEKKHITERTIPGLVPPLLLEAPKRAVKLLVTLTSVACRIPSLIFIYFWLKKVLLMISGERHS